MKELCTLTPGRPHCDKIAHLIKKHLGLLHVQGIHDLQASEDSLRHKGRRQTKLQSHTSSSRGGEGGRRNGDRPQSAKGNNAETLQPGRRDLGQQERQTGEMG